MPGLNPRLDLRPVHEPSRDFPGGDIPGVQSADLTGHKKLNSAKAKTRQWVDRVFKDGGVAVIERDLATTIRVAGNRKRLVKAGGMKSVPTQVPELSREETWRNPESTPLRPKGTRPDMVVGEDRHPCAEQRPQWSKFRKGDFICLTGTHAVNQSHTPARVITRFPTPVKVLHVESGLNWGGQEERTVSELRWLNRNGHVAWLACNPSSAIRRRTDGNAVPVKMSRCVDPRATAAIRGFCKKHGVDIVHAHSPKDAWLCVPLHAMGIPVVRSRQITNPVSPKWSRSIVYRAGCRHLIATAECIRQDLIRRNRVEARRITVVGEGVDLGRFQPRIGRSSFKREFGISEETPLFGVLAMIRPEKGHRFFVEAAGIVLKTQPTARFVIVGEGTGTRETEHGIRRQIRSAFGSEHDGPLLMTGFRDDVERVIAGLDALVVPSTAEAQSLVIPQAFASGRPVIATSVGGIPELVRHEETGLLVPAGDSAALAAAMIRLIQQPALRIKLGNAGLEYARKYLNFEDRMAETLSVYREAISGKPRRTRQRARSSASRPHTRTAKKAGHFRRSASGLLVLALMITFTLWDQSEADAGWTAVAPSRPHAFQLSLPKFLSANPIADQTSFDFSEIPPNQDDDDVLT